MRMPKTGQRLTADLDSLRYTVFESWHHLMDFMIQGLQLESPLESRLKSKLIPEFSPKLDTS